MKTFTVVVERCPETGLFVGYVLGLPGAHSQGETLDELRENLREAIALLLEGEEGEAATLSEVGDFHAQLTDYEARLARGEIRWR